MNKSDSIIRQLAGRIGNSKVLREVEDILPYRFDATATFKQMPLCVVFPTSTEDVVEIVKLANEHGTSIVCRGSGTGLSAGSVPVENSIVVCMTHMDQILDIDSQNHTVTVEPGVITQDLQHAVSEAGLFYPPDPSSMKISTIGGNLAENSGGLRGLKYGVTRNYVMALEVVLADGRVCNLGSRCVKDVAGFSLKDLFIGSEGTLGVITKATLKIVPKPESKCTLLACFDEMEMAAETVSEIIASNIIPCTLEFLDRTTIQCVEDFASVGLPDVGALLLIETDGPAEVADKEMKLVEKLCKGKGAVSVKRAKTQEEANQLTLARRSAFSALARLSPTTILEDVTVPRSELGKMVREIERISRKYDLQIATFGHFGDGNLHPTILTDERNSDEMLRVELAFEEIVEVTLKLKGTITGEHGVGLAKKRFLKMQLGEEASLLLESIKKTLDPKCMLNPGKILDRY